MTHIMKIDEMVNRKGNAKIMKSDLRNDFFSLGDSMLLDSGLPIADFEVEYHGNIYEVSIETQGEVRVNDLKTEDTYYKPSEFPMELKNGIKNGNVDTNRFETVNNNWYEVFLSRKNAKSIIDSEVMECEPKDFKNIDDVNAYILDFVESFNL